MAGNADRISNPFQRRALEIAQQRPERFALVKAYFEKRGVKV